jgi:hypothetical protein
VVRYQRFRGPSCLHLHSENGGWYPSTKLRVFTTQKTSTCTVIVINYRSSIHKCHSQIHISFVFLISVPPDILDYPTSTDMVVREGTNVTLRCAATGSPQPSIIWRREGGEAIPLGNGQEG